MGKVYLAPKEIKKPIWNSDVDYKYFRELEDQYEKEIVSWAKTYGRGTERGKVVDFPVADGRARYIVFSLKPIALIHIDTGDAYQFQYVERLTAQDLKKQINSREALIRAFKGEK